MAKQTIIKKWAEDTHNKYELSEEQVKTGIARLGNIVSNQLNAVANRADIMIDLLQRCSAWNVNKTYQQGDICMVSIYYKRPSDAQHKYYIMFLISTKNDNTEIPLINNGATSFTRNDDLSTPCFTITANSEIILSNFVNGTGWAFADSTCGDLTNCVNLAVSEVAHFKGNTSFDGNVVANSNINLAGNLTTQGHLELAGTASFNNSVTLNGLVNTATTPTNTAFANEIVTAKWVKEYFNQIQGNYLPDVRNNFILNVDFKIKEDNFIQITAPSEFFDNFLYFGWRLELNNGDIYKSKKEYNYNGVQSIFHSMTDDNQLYKYQILDLSLMERTFNFTGTYNNVDFNYNIQVDSFGILEDSQYTYYLNIKIFNFSSIEEVTGKFAMIMF